MKTKLLFSILLMIACSIPLISQVIIVDSLPDYTPENDQLYLATNWYNYECGQSDFVMHKNQDDKWEITIEPPYPTWTTLWYFVNRGSWKTLETDSLNKMFNQRLFQFSPGDTVRIKIHNWYDKKNKPSTAAGNVIRLSDNFPIPELNKTRGISLYLPPDYEVSSERYPVIYMHDGQNLFDSYATWETDEWKVDETLNELASEGLDVPIIVAIENGPYNRMSELSPWSYSYRLSDFVGQGDNYIDFITNTLKPYIDSVYRTLPERGSTCIMGASLGGLISFYGAIKSPDVFGKAGLFSPSYHNSDSIWNFLRDAEKIHPMRLYQMVGSEEVYESQGIDMPADVMGMHGVLGSMGFSENEITYKIVEGGVHNYSLWGPEFREAYLWLFPEANTTSVNRISYKELSVYPNPASNILNIETPLLMDDLSIQIYNMSGEAVRSEYRHSGNQIHIENLPVGLYILRITGRQVNYSGKFIKE